MAETNRTKAKYWTAVLYPENMVDGWEDAIGDILGLPGEYCVHDKDSLAKYSPKQGSEDYQRKAHVHLMIAYSNTTTYNHAMMTFNKLSAPGKQALNKCESVNNVRHMHEYLIHNTETCRKQGKYEYAASERISFNNFDIGAYEQLSLEDKNRMTKELCDFISNNNFCNFVDFYDNAMNIYGFEYFEIIKTYSGLFERLCKGNYHKVMHSLKGVDAVFARVEAEKDSLTDIRESLAEEEARMDDKRKDVELHVQQLQKQAEDAELQLQQLQKQVHDAEVTKLKAEGKCDENGCYNAWDRQYH